MGSIGNPIVTGLVQAAQAQQVAARDGDRTRNARETARERADRLDLRVEQAEAPEAVRSVEDDDRPQDDGRSRRQDADVPERDATSTAEGGPGSGPDDEPRPSLDLQA